LSWRRAPGADGVTERRVCGNQVSRAADRDSAHQLPCGRSGTRVGDGVRFPADPPPPPEALCTLPWLARAQAGASAGERCRPDHHDDGRRGAAAGFGPVANQRGEPDKAGNDDGPEDRSQAGPPPPVLHHAATRPSSCRAATRGVPNQV
jgi:hypothetical protein